MMTRQELWQSLRDKGWVEGEEPAADPAASPWYIRVMLGVAGWIGALFLLGFVGVALSFVMDSPTMAAVAGLLCCTGAFVLFRAVRNNDFVDQLGLAVSLTGQFLVAYGLFESLDSFRSGWGLACLFLFLFEAALAVLVPNFIHRVLTSCAALLALAVSLSRIEAHGLAPAVAAAGFAFIWLDEMRWARSAALWRPIGYGCVLALLTIDAGLTISHRTWFVDSIGWMALHAQTIGAVLTGTVLLQTVARLLARERLTFSQPVAQAAIAATLLLILVSLYAPGIATAMLILLIGFAAGNRVLTGLGLFSLVAFVSHYYYQLETTLLVKSAVLAVTGLVLLAARVFLDNWLGSAEPKEHRDA